MRRTMRLFMIIAALSAVIVVMSSSAFAQAFYIEEAKDGRIYVFNNIDHYTQWKVGGEMGASTTRIGYGPNGETVVFDSNDAINVYNYKHNLPLETFAAAPASPAPQEKLPYKFSGLMFGDYFYKTDAPDEIATLPNVAIPGAKDFNAFVYRRIYFTFDDQISDKFSARFRLESNNGQTTTSGNYTVFVKDAYLKWSNIFNGSDFTFGMQPTPAYDVSETQWAFRSLEKTIMDLRGTVPSRDLAAGLRGRIDSGGKFNYWVMFGNGSGNTPETDKYKRLYFHVQWKPNDKFMATLYQDYRALPDIADPNNSAALIGNSSYTTAWFVNYGTKDKFGVAYEGFMTKQQNGNKAGSLPPFTLSDKTTAGHSFWGWYYFNQMVGVVGRYDLYDPNTDASGDKRDLFIASLVLKPHKNVFVMPNLEVEKYQDLPTGQSFKSSVMPRITFYYTFP